MATPTPWLAPFQANTGTAATGGQFDPQIIGLSNGNILVAWTESASGAIGTAAGSDIIGKIYDAEGNVVRDAFQLNSFQIDDERDFDLAPTNDGGFVIVYVDDSISGANLTTIRWQRHGADGNANNSSSVKSENVADQGLSDPQVAFDLTTQESFVAWTDDEGADINLNGVILNSTGGVAHAEFDAGQNSPDSDRDSDITFLSGGRIAAVYEEDDGGTIGIELKIMNNDGTSVFNPQVVNAGTNPSIAALANGNIVVTWEDTTNNDVRFRIYDANGSAVLGETVVAAAGGDDQNEPDVVALPDGGFIIAWDDDTDNRVEAKAFLADGTADGSQFTLRNNNDTTPNIGVTGDGRLLAVSDSVVNGEEIFASIWDTRESSTIDANDFLGSRIFVRGNTVTGRLGASTINGNGINSLTLLGQDGNDTIIGGVNAQTINGGGGDDVIDGGLAAGSNVADSIEGGSGNDSITGANGDDTIAGGAGNDTITSNGGDDLLSGAGGNDFFDARSGNDTVFGGSLTDDVFGGSGNDVLNGEGGGDRMNGGSGADVLNGGSGNDLLIGGPDNDRIIGEAGDDMIQGGSGFDTVDYSTAAAAVIVNLAAGSASGAMSGTDTLIGIENVIGSALDDTLLGDTLDNRLDGAGGEDFLDGKAGNDELLGGTRADEMFGGSGFDTIQGSAGNDRVNGGSGADIINGGGDNDLLIGGPGNDTINGGSGADQLIGGSGDDVFVFDAGAESATIDGFIAGMGTVDSLDFSSLGINFGNLTIIQQGANTQITAPGGISVTLLNVAPGDLDMNDDFVF